MRPLRLLRPAALAFGVVAFANACGTEPEPPRAPTRACGLVVWHKPANAQAHVEILGDWNGWQRPGVVPDRRDDGWRVAALDPPPGEHAYAIVEDGVWLADRNTPITEMHDGHEVALAIVPDCGTPELAVTGVEVGAETRVQARFLAARGGSPISKAAITITSDDPAAPPLTVGAVDEAQGTLTAIGAAPMRGKYIYTIRAKDREGREADARATVWAGPTWDPKDAIVYQVMVDRYRGPEGAALPTPKTPSARAGGTLSGVTHAITSGAIEALGANTIWLTPLYENPEGDFPGNDGRAYSSYHGYWPRASRALDRRVATDVELETFMREAHARGIRVLFDVVPNHVHEQHPWRSEHPDWFKQGCVCGQGSCDWGAHIKTCWFAPYLPDLDWTNRDAARAATAEVMWWFDRWGADGIRIDAVPMMPRGATRRIALAVRKQWEHAGNVPYILGENFTGPGGYQSLRYDLGPYGLDGSFHFPLMWTLRAVLADEAASMYEIGASFTAGEEAWSGAGAVMGLMIGNHDVSRFASAAAGNAGGDAWTPAPQPLDPAVYAKTRVALATVFTLPGAPVLYYGDEVGLAGKSDPDCRRVMPDEKELIASQRDLRDVVGRIGRARACSRALRRGSMLAISDAMDRERFVFAREDGDDTAIVALARRPSLPVTVTLPPKARRAYVDVVSKKPFDGSAGTITFEADAFGVHVLVPADSTCAK